MLSPITKDANATVTIPVPKLISAVLLYCAIKEPERPVKALDRQSPTVMVKVGLMEEARTIAGLSPVARIDRPSPVLKNHFKKKQRRRTIILRRITTPHSFKKALSPAKSVKIVSVPKMDRLEEKPITAKFTV